MPKTLAEITEALTQKYRGPIREKDGYSYIPWPEMVKWLNDQIGIENYDVQIKEYHQEVVRSLDDEGQEHTTYGYSSVVALTIRPSDAPAFTREGLGFNELQFSKRGQALIDTSVKGAASNGLSRTAPLLGDFGGLFLYEKDTPPASQPTGQATSNKPVLSEGRVNVLKNKQFPPSAITQIQTQWDWKRVKALFDDLMQQGLSTQDALKKYGLTSATGKTNAYPF